MAQANKHGRNQQAGPLQAPSSKTPAKAKKGYKRPGDALAELIRLVNLVPGDAWLPEQLFETPERWVLSKSEWSQLLRGAIEALPEHLKELKAYLIEFLNSVPDESLAPARTIARYEEIRQARSALDTLAQLNEPVPENPEGVSILQASITRLGYFWTPIRSGSVIRINSAGKAEVRFDWFSSAIQGEEITYIRKCKMCGRFFFAGRDSDRVKQWYCPPPDEFVPDSPNCAKKKRNKTWKTNYEAKHGHPYKPPSNKPRHVEKIRSRHVEKIQRFLTTWEDFERNYENEKELAALADISLRQCQTALDYMFNGQTKRAKTAPKR